MGEPETRSRPWAYVGVGCLTAVIGLAGGGMIAVLVAKVVGAIRGCAPNQETGAPCGWSTYWTWGAWAGLLLVPAAVLWRMRRAERRHPASSNIETG
jgi:hypothetical protein